MKLQILLGKNLHKLLTLCSINKIGKDRYNVRIFDETGKLLGYYTFTSTKHHPASILELEITSLGRTNIRYDPGIDITQIKKEMEAKGRIFSLEGSEGVDKYFENLG